MISEAFQRTLNEENEDAQVSLPIEIQPSYFQGNYYFNVTVRDKSVFEQIANISGELSTRAAKVAIRKLEKPTKEQLVAIKKKAEENKQYFLKTYQVITSDKSNTITENTNYIIIKTKVENPKTILTEDGELNTSSSDARKIYQLMKFLQSLMGFGNQIITNSFKTMYYFVVNRPSAETKEEVDRETRKLFYKLCQTIGEEKTRKLIERIQIDDDSFIVDYQYDLKNKLRIIAQATIYDQKDPSANQVNTISYLLTPRQWNNLGREVVDFRFPYHTVTFNGGRVSEKDAVDNARTHGKIGLMKESKYGQQTQRALVNRSNKEENNRYSFSYNDAIYDVQATEVIGGFVDKFNKEPGMKNNLTGELNDVAIEKINAMTKPNDGGDRTQKLNDIFGTNSYEGVNLTYEATCMTAGIKPSIGKDGDIKGMIKETTRLINDMLIKKMSGVKGEDGRIANPQNYLPLIPIGVIMIQAQIGLPMDDAPAVKWASEHEHVANALFNPVFAITHKILANKQKIHNIQKENLTEMIELYSPLFIFEETFNYTLNLIKENAQYI